MNSKVSQQLSLLQKRWFTCDDEEKVRWYMEKVWYHRLSFYFKNAPQDIERVIGLYIFDKRLRLLILDMLEVIENALKSVMVNYIWKSFWYKHRYVNKNIYKQESSDKRLSFVFAKIVELKEKDPIIKYFFWKHDKETEIPDYLFFDKLTFGELLKIFEDLNFDYQKEIASYFWIVPTLFIARMKCLHYLRNLCSHYENIFNRKMTFAIRAEKIEELFWVNNMFISYFAILSLFNKLLIENYNRPNKIIELMGKFWISFMDFWRKENLPSELESEAWKVLVQSLYGKYVKKSNLFETT